MPIYEYECSKCSHRFEEWARVNDPFPIVCPKCGQSKPERLISLTGNGKVSMSAREIYEKRIRPEAKDIAHRIRSGDQEATADIFGEK